jgi:Flp pilus assembly protein TadG
MEQISGLMKPNSRRGERGSVLTYTVLSVLFLFLAVGLGVDLSHLYSVKNELQNAADAAALAGASALLLPQDVKITTAVDRAVATLNKNKYNFNNEQFDAVMSTDAQRDLVEFAVNLDGTYYKEADAKTMADIRFVRVQTPTVPVNVFFSIPILGLTRTMTTTATSGLSVNSNVFCNFVPIAVIEGAFGGGLGWMDTNNDGHLTPADCNPPPPPKKCDENGRNCTGCDPATEFCAGCKYKMMAGPGAFQDSSPGNYQALDAGAGAKDLKLAIAGGTTNCITSNDDAVFITETEPGRMTGPVSKGLNTRFDIYKTSDCPTGAHCSNFGGANATINGITKPIEEWFPPDLNVYAGPGPPPPPKGKGGGKPADWNYAGIWNYQYLAATEIPAVNFKKPTHEAGDHRREIYMPIINKKEFQPGKDEVKFTRVGKFFMNKFVDEGNNAIFVEYIGPAFGAGGFDPEGGNDAPVVVPVLYR